MNDIRLYFSRKCSRLLWCEKQTETNGDGGRLPYWPTTSLDHNPMCYLQGLTWYFFGFSVDGYSTGGSLWATLKDATSDGRTATHWYSPWPSESLLAARWDWLKTETARILRGHLHISFRNTHTFPFKHAYLHSCVLCLEISNWWLGEGSVCSTTTKKCYYERTMNTVTHSS